MTSYTTTMILCGKVSMYNSQRRWKNKPCCSHGECWAQLWMDRGFAVFRFCRWKFWKVWWHQKLLVVGNGILNPGDEITDFGVNSRIIGQSAASSPRHDTLELSIDSHWSTGVTLDQAKRGWKRHWCASTKTIVAIQSNFTFCDIWLL